MIIAAALGACSSTAGVTPTVDMAHMYELREQYLGDVARMNGIADPPETPALVRWVTAEEWPQVMARCLTENGVSAEVTSDGGFSYSGDKSVYGIVVWTCQAEYTLDPRLNEPLDDRQIAVLYDYLVKDLAPCVEAKGYEVTEPPSLALYREAIASGGEEAWSPYDRVFQGDVSPQSWQELNQDCPQTAPFEEMYGEPLQATAQ